MNRRANFLLAAGAALLALFALGLLQLFQLRFDRGDIYPPYSSLRADPLGARALLLSLGAVPGITATSLLEPVPKLGGGRDTTLLVLGTAHHAVESLPRQDVRDLEQFMNDGGRVVFAFHPFSVESRYRRLEAERERKEQEKSDAKKSPDEKAKPGAKPAKKPAKPDPQKNLQPGKTEKEKDESRLPEAMRRVQLDQQWGVAFTSRDLVVDADGVPSPTFALRREAAVELPAKLAWHTALGFTNLTASWRTNYQRDDLPVVIERPFGRGSLVFCADSFPFSNEALRRDRQTAWLAWALGPNHRVAFDETHLRVEETPGVATLAWRYRLHGLFAGLGVLALLFVWKNATSLVPPHDEEAGELGGALVGKDSAAAFVNLLRRSIPASELLSVCVAEWRKSAAHAAVARSARRGQIEAAIAAHESTPARAREPVKTYLELSKLLNERK